MRRPREACNPRACARSLPQELPESSTRWTERNCGVLPQREWGFSWRVHRPPRTADTYKLLHPSELDPFASVTGKPLSMHGIPGRREATGLGVYYGICECMNVSEDMKEAGRVSLESSGMCSVVDARPPISWRVLRP